MTPKEFALDEELIQKQLAMDCSSYRNLRNESRTVLKDVSHAGE